MDIWDLFVTVANLTYTLSLRNSIEMRHSFRVILNNFKWYGGTVFIFLFYEVISFLTLVFALKELGLRSGNSHILDV